MVTYNVQCLPAARELLLATSQCCSFDTMSTGEDAEFCLGYVVLAFVFKHSISM